VGVGQPGLEDLVIRAAAAAPRCRFCDAVLRHSFADLGMSPLANAYVAPNRLQQPERFYPLHAYVCERCFLVQLPTAVTPDEIFSDYAYFSSYSDSWLEHARRFVDEISERLELGPANQVVELASNDGYLLRWFIERGIPVLGVEPAANVAAIALARGIPTVTEFFGREVGERLVREGHAADLVVGNNVLAHVPDMNDFVAGVTALLKPDGVVTMEFPHLLQLIEETEFDTIYHEHFSYFSFLTVRQVFRRQGLTLFDVEELPTHGGSLRIYGARARPETKRPEELLARERAAGLGSIEIYTEFEARVREAKRALLEFLIDARRDGRSVVGYGAAAKGTTLLNYCGARADLVDYVVDRSPYKQGLFMPGTRIPIHAPERVAETKPDYVLVLAWNLAREIMAQMAHVREWGCRFVTPIPRTRVHD
jgi:SAM-dependent methyltransferase